ncbi:DUF2807 domain-containing protein [Phenylobacterium sp. LjRoot219]|uniref:GIN domain-containing protein n=1 Tax=Phenylobacterium sp. LjRoot219 TaxID=3342283 RepID=UPI003ECD18CF
MRAPIALLAGAVASLAAAQAAAAATALEIKDAVAQLTIIPEDRADVRVEVIAGHPRLPLKLKDGRGRIVIDGGLDGGRIRSCSGDGATALVRIAGVGDVALKDMPRVVVRTPRDVDVAAGGAVFGVIGRARNVTLGAAGCGDWTVANVQHRLAVNLAGSGDARAGSAGEAKLRVAGSGDIAAGDVRGRLEADVAGTGNVRVRSVAGPLDVRMAGSGDVVVAEGRATAMTVSMAGSGNAVFGGVADSLSARVAGSGDVRVRQVRGAVRRSVMGSGSVKIGGVPARPRP